MRPSLIVVALAFAALAATPALASSVTYYVNYVAHPLLAPRVVGSQTGIDPGLGGSTFPTHPHDATADITVVDAVAGPIDALVCQDRNNNFVCDAVPGSGDVWACTGPDGVLTGFPIAGATPGSPKKTTVFVQMLGFRLEVCNTVGRASYGSIALTYN